MDCPKCGKKLSVAPMSMCLNKQDNEKKLFCWGCMKLYYKSDLQSKKLHEQGYFKKH